MAKKNNYYGGCRLEVLAKQMDEVIDFSYCQEFLTKVNAIVKSMDAVRYMVEDTSSADGEQVAVFNEMMVLAQRLQVLAIDTVKGRFESSIYEMKRFQGFIYDDDDEDSEIDE